jgi:hypothetical protein
MRGSVATIVSSDPGRVSGLTGCTPKPKPIHVQIIVSTNAGAKKFIVPGTPAIICGYGYHEDVATAKVLPMEMGAGRYTRYRALQIPLHNLRPMDRFSGGYSAIAGHG